MAEISKVRFGGVDYDIKSITDTSLSETGTPADAAAVGNNIDILKQLQKANVIVEIGTNRFIENGSLKTTALAKRASTPPFTPVGTKFYIAPKGKYTISAGKLHDGVWSYLFETASTPQMIEVDSRDSIFIAVQLSTNIPSDADMFEMFYVVQSITDDIISNMYPDVNSYTGINLGWTIGTLNSSNGKEISGNTRIRTSYIKVGKGTVIKITDGAAYKYLVYKYDLEKSFVSAGDWGNIAITITEDCYIRILVRNNNNATITAETLSTLAEQITIEYALAYTNFFDDPDFPIYDIKENIHRKDEIDILKQKKTTSEAWGQCDLKIMFFTDAHGDSVRTARMTDLVNSWGADYFDVAICGGDIAQLIITEDLNWYYDATSNINVPLLNTVGNHDAWESLNATLAPKTDVYNKIIAPIVASSSISQPDGAATNGFNYYYKDFGVVRVIVLDCMYYDNAERAWFESVLADAKTNSKHVLCVSHAAFPLADMQAVDCQWSKSGVNTDGVRTSIELASAVKSFMDDGGNFIAWVVGHQHGDYVHTLPNHGNQFVVNLASFAQRAGYLLKNTDKSKYNYDCLTYIAVDTTNKNIRFMRIGADIDIFGTQYHGLVIDYNSNKVISAY